LLEITLVENDARACPDLIVGRSMIFSASMLAPLSLFAFN
jgi:hypothetical protein